MSKALPRRRGASVVTGYAAMALLGLAACAPSKPKTAPTPMNDPRVGLKAGLFDAGEAISNMKVVAKAVSPPGFLGITNSDLAFTGKYAIQGNYNGPVIWDISNPAKPVLVVAYTCPASQNDISVYKNLMFMSAEANNGRVDCKPGGVPDPVSKDRIRGVRVFDITNIREPKLIANVQTCRGSHTHTVLEDPKDKDNVYIYVSGSSGIRSAGELAGCADVAADDPNSSRLRIEIIKVPLANPASAAVVGRANIFAGLSAAPAHGLSDADEEAAAGIGEMEVDLAGADLGVEFGGNPGDGGGDIGERAAVVGGELHGLADAEPVGAGFGDVDDDHEGARFDEAEERGVGHDLVADGGEFGGGHAFTSETEDDEAGEGRGDRDGVGGSGAVEDGGGDGG